MAEPSTDKLDVKNLVETWERLGPLAGSPNPSPGLLQELSDFVFRMASALPELARVYVQHDDAMRAAFFISSKGMAVHVTTKDGAPQSSDELAKAYIVMARHFGWKPPRECD
jgi:hypothetical protein